MRRDLYFAWFFSFLLIGMGFVLGQFYSGNGGFLQQGKTLSWTAPSLLTETSDEYSLFIDGIAIDHLWKQEPAEEIIFPARVGALHMDKLISGTEALEYAWRIHGDDAPFDSVFIPYYSGRRGEQVTVWILEIHSTIEARKHLKKINDRITATHHSDKYGSFYLQEVQVFHLRAANENNYYYRKDNNIYWISLITSDPIPLFLRFYEHF